MAPEMNFWVSDNNSVPDGTATAKHLALVKPSEGDGLVALHKTEGTLKNVTSTTWLCFICEAGE